MATKDIGTLMRSRTAFGKLPAKELEEQRKALRYIELIAMQANIPINSWDVAQVFRAGASKKLITDPKEINKRIFATHANTKDLNKTLALLDVYEAHEELKNLKAPNLERNIESHKLQIQQFTRLRDENKKRGDGYSVAYYDKQVKVYERSIKSMTMPINAYEDAIRIVNDGFWKFLKVNSVEGTISFITANNIVLFDKNPASKLSLHKDMGQFMLTVDVSGLGAYVQPFKGNTAMCYSDDGDSDGYIHPYVSSGGVCTGNASRAYDNARNQKNLYKIVTIMGSILGTYNSGNGPHVTLYQFTKRATSDNDLTFIKSTYDSKTYDARKAKQLLNYKERLKELAPVIPKLRKVPKKNFTKTKNVLAKAMGKAPIALARITHDDSNDDELEEQMAEAEMQMDEDDSYF